MVFQELSNAMADAVENAGSGIIRVEGRKRLGATGIVWSDDLVVTAHHVLRRDDGLKVGLPDGSVVSATLVGRDGNSDVAVLRVDGAGLSPLSRAESDSARVGHLVLAIGKPGENLQATVGVISATETRRMDGVLRTDVVMYPGFSGGPLINASGQVLGMNTSGFRGGASITISNKVLDNVVSTLVQHGKMQQGYLGIGAQPVRLPENLAAELDQETGLMLATIESDSPASKGGLFQGDIIVAVDGEPTPHLDALLLLLSGNRVGSTVPVKIVRGGQVQKVSITIGERS